MSAAQKLMGVRAVGSQPEHPKLALVMSQDAIESLIDERVARALAAYGATEPAPPLAEHLTKQEVATELRVTVRTVSRYVSVGRLAAVQVAGGKVLVTRESLRLLLATGRR